MFRMHRSRRVLAALLLAAAGLACRPADADPGDPAPPQTKAQEPAPSWSAIDALIADQKLAEAARALAAVEAAARGRGDDRELARALVRATQVGLALGGYETAVEALRGREWPGRPLPRAAVELYYAHALIAYLDAYGWEVNQREKVVAGEQLDLKLWTRDQILAESDRAFARVWGLREALGGTAADDFEYLEANDYPRGIRPTLRDAVAYLWAARLADTSHWAPAAAAETWKLALPALIDGTAAEPTPERLSDPELHPLARLAAVLGDLERWHRSRKEAGAALEARLERLADLHAALGATEDREAIRAALARSLEEFRADPWWAMGEARLAGLWRESDAADALVRAREIALAGERAFPGSPGAQACRAEREAIEAPEFGLEAMGVDAPGERSVAISHRNLPRLYFRAFRLPDERFEERAVRYPGWNDERVRPILATTAAASWTVELPATADFRDHRTFTTPPLSGRGRYLVVASADASFRERRNRLHAVELLLSDLVVLRDPAFGRTADADVVRVVSGADGRPLAGATATLYRWRWEKKPELVERVTTGADGLARFARLAEPGDGNGVAVVVRQGDDEAVWSQGWWWGRIRSAAAPSQGALVFTDRAIYRPGQKLFWKVLVYQGEAARGRLRASSGHAVGIRLRDPNGEVVASADATTNDYGSAAGELAVPTGRLLGNWSLQAEGLGSAAIAVEEYKRPTFEVALEAPAGEPRLNRPVELPGEARYYFGLPVASGRVAWRVTRSELPGFEGWGWWWRPAPPPRTVASGVAEIGSDGRFTVRFTPEADERERSRCGCWRYAVAAEVTDEGGETRAAERSLALGWVGVALAVDGEPFLLGPGSERSWTLLRRDLDQQPRPGKSSWRLVELVQPGRAPLPADLPARVAEEAEPYATPGDRLSPRWSNAPPSEAILAGWSSGREVARGELAHGTGGDAKLALPELAPGAYRLLAETLDAHGEKATLERSFVVTGSTGERTALALPLELRFEKPSVEVGGTARLFVHSGLPGQTIALDLVRGEEVRARRTLVAGRDPEWIELPVAADDRGGFGVRAAIVSDHQLVSRSAAVAVPWDDKQLTVELATFRDKLEPGRHETFRVVVKDRDGEPLGAGAAELLASMYDRSLDLFRPHAVPRVAALYPGFGAPAAFEDNLGLAPGWNGGRDWYEIADAPDFTPDAFVAIDPYGIGGPGYGPLRRMAKGDVAMAMPAAAPAPVPQGATRSAEADSGQAQELIVLAESTAVTAPAAIPLRSDFSETALWQPHLVTGRDGSAAIEFRVPESLTAWKLDVSAWTRDLASGFVEKEVKTAKDLMVRPYLPRFLREGDRADLRVEVNDASDHQLAGEVKLAIVDADTQEDLSAAFGLPAGGARASFAAEPGRSASLAFAVTTPRGPRPVAFRVEARSGALSDGELRPLPVLPARIELAQSRFAALKGPERRELVFADLAKEDPTRINERLVVTVDAQLFEGMLAALPYLVDYPYECTEQTLNRFVSSGILAALFDRYPAVAKMAASLSARETKWERFDTADPNRRMALEETPWLREARGGGGEDEALLRVLDPAVARAVRADALGKLRQAQLPSGAFPWFPGGPPSPWMTLYLMDGLARAASFGVDVPKEMVTRGWAYLAGEIERDWWKEALAHDCCWESLTYANYVATSYPDPSWMGDVLPEKQRQEILAFSFKHWKQHSPMLKLMLSSTLHRMKRDADARLVLASVMDSAKSDRDLGTYWAPEDRAWLWYNDTIETHAWALRTVMEVTPGDARAEGLVQWLFLNKKLGHWKSTRATAEVLYSLAKYLEQEKLLGQRQEVVVHLGPQPTTLAFAPDRYTGARNQVVLDGDGIDPRRDAKVVVEQTTPGFAFASATWHFSTEQLPAEMRGDLFTVERKWFRRVKTGREVTLEPLAEGARLAVGDELEVQLAVTAKAAAEYVHLRDPRAAGLEPATSESGWRWDLGLSFYEETRDSGTNFFFEWLPAGEYTLHYRLRANVAGEFRAAPAQLQSMYAPEFVAYSAGAKLTIAPAGR